MLLKLEVKEYGSDRPLKANVGVNGIDLESEGIRYYEDRTDNGILLIENFLPSYVFAKPEDPYFWSGILHRPSSGDAVYCRKLKVDGNLGWWHRCIGIHTWSESAGEGVTIGVVDRGFNPCGGICHASVKTCKGTIDFEHAGDVHGEMVCRIIGQRPTSKTGLGGIAPGSRIVCIEANGNEKLDMEKIADGIFHLAANENADIINLSFGLYNNYMRTAREAIRVANELGSICIVAAGNKRGEEVSFPARYEECVAVGALGKCGWPPPDTVAESHEKYEPKRLGTVPGFGDIYHWAFSSYGEGLDVIAPGAAIIAPMDNDGYDISGTSFAAPIVSGALAVALSNDAAWRRMPRDKWRAEYMKERLFRLCHPTRLGKRFEGRGCPIV